MNAIKFSQAISHIIVELANVSDIVSASVITVDVPDGVDLDDDGEDSLRNVFLNSTLMLLIFREAFMAAYIYITQNTGRCGS
jgi:hypothetical protein